MTRKFSSIKGEHPCKICGTVYQYSDLRDACEGTEYYNNVPFPYVTLDELQASVGEKVLLIRYFGNEYANLPLKNGVFSAYFWKEIREKRIVPIVGDRDGGFHREGERYKHRAEYRFVLTPEEAKYTDIAPDYWTKSHVSSGFLYSKASTEREGNKWPDYPIDGTVGEWSKDLMKKKKDEGYDVYV